MSKLQNFHLVLSAPGWSAKQPNFKTLDTWKVGSPLLVSSSLFDIAMRTYITRKEHEAAGDYAGPVIIRGNFYTVLEPPVFEPLRETANIEAVLIDMWSGTGAASS